MRTTCSDDRFGRGRSVEAEQISRNKLESARLRSANLSWSVVLEVALREHGRFLL